jgi:Concanavalin A-like lectin/glucanases superfamily/Calcineurin-like phosphoesterase
MIISILSPLIEISYQVHIYKYIFLFILEVLLYKYTILFIILFSFLIIGSLSIGETSYHITSKAYAQSTFPNFNFAAVGDWDCGSNAIATRDSIINTNPELVVGLGDYSYEANADCWLNVVNPFDHKMKIAIGNHEIDESPQSLGQYLNHFNMPTQYHSFNHQNVHFLILATDDTFGLNSNQYNFAVNDLQTASSDSNIDWIVVAFHKPFYDVPCSGDSCQDEDAVQGSTYPRTLYHPLFDQYGVDLALYGHAHNYVRTFPIKYDSSTPDSPIITSTNQNNYVNEDGQVFVQSGAGGRSLRDLTGTENYNAFQSDSEFGILNVDVVNTNSNNLQLVGKFIQNDGDVIDQFTITKQTPSQEICNNGLDDDGDGLVDTADPDCQTPPPQENCNNGVDDDGDGLKDAEDPDCPLVPEICNNGLDDDGDGLVDTADPDCQTTGYPYSPFFTATGSNYLDVPNDNLRLKLFSVAAWFKTSNTFTENGFIVNKGGLGKGNDKNQMNYGIWMTSSGNIQGGFETSKGSGKFIKSSNIYNDDQWHHVTLTYNGQVLIMYIDGSEVGRMSIKQNQGPDDTSKNPLRIGANSAIVDNFFTGNIDEIGVWGRALDQTEITKLMNGEFPTNGLYRNSFDQASTSSSSSPFILVMPR